MAVVELELTLEDLSELSIAPSNTTVRGESDPEKLDEK
jgi:hypothetical protein